MQVVVLHVLKLLQVEELSLVGAEEDFIVVMVQVVVEVN